MVSLQRLFVNYMDSETGCTLSRFMDDTKLRGAADNARGKRSHPEDFDRLMQS